VALDVELSKGGAPLYVFSNIITDETGNFTLAAIQPGTYDIRVDTFHTLTNLRRGVILDLGPNFVHMGVLQEGDATGDNLVDIDDFGYIKVYFGTNYPPADFNQDRVVDIDDFGLLKLNFGEYGAVLIAGD